MKAAVTFALGVAVGLALGYAAFRTGTSAMPSPTTAPPSMAAAPPAASVAPAVVPSPTPIPVPPPASAWPTPAEAAPLGPVPSAVPGDSTDAHLDAKTLAPASGPTPLPLAGISDFDRLRARALIVPVEGFERARLRDNFSEQRGARVHEAIDLLAPRGTPVVAVDDGLVKKLFTSGAGGLTVYQYDPSQAYAYYYAHLDRYAEGLAEGKAVKKGDRIGYVGTTGNAPPGTPHLHFTIYRLGADKRWWEGTPINPYPLWALAR